MSATEKVLMMDRIKNFNFGVLFLIVVMLLMTILPVPPFLLDLLFTSNITLSLIVLMVCVYVVRPLEFSIFPTILLVTTLLRLTLNIASTRVVLLHGNQGPSARVFEDGRVGGRRGDGAADHPQLGPGPRRRGRPQRTDHGGRNRHRKPRNLRPGLLPGTKGRAVSGCLRREASTTRCD